MTTLLERGIIAARKGNNTEARTLLIQALKQNNRNEQAWLWLSEVVDTMGEQISCIEQVLEINPDNHIARLALQKLKSQPARPAVPAPQTAVSYHGTPHPSSGASSMAYYHQPGTRKPFRLSEVTGPIADDPAVHHQLTVSMPPMPMPDSPEQHQALFRRAESATQGMRVANTPSRRVQPAKSDKLDLDSIPLLPLVLFGTLSMTALGGIGMIMLLVFFN